VSAHLPPALSTCERCGHATMSLHCKIRCPNCGHFLDCTDLEIPGGAGEGHGAQEQDGEDEGEPKECV
jgi:hypothetical protein